jgi:two-component sensor histidine kinase
MQDLPLVLVTGLARQEVLAAWWHRAYQTGALTLMGLGAIATLAVVASRHAAREERALRELAESRQHERLLMAEVDHRAKNLLSLVQSLVRQTARASADVQDLETALGSRIQALASAHELLSAEKWTAVDLRTLIVREVGPFEEGGRIRLDGPHVRIPARATVTLGMAVHELATNAVKHGSLSVPQGSVDVSWRLDEPEHPELRLTWIETGGPHVREPAKTGFGTTLLERSIAQERGGSLRLDYRPEGLRAELVVPLPDDRG